MSIRKIRDNFANRSPLIRKKEAEQNSIENIREKIEEAECIVVGAGSGLSSAAGLDYQSESFFADKYSVFQKKGYKTVWDGLIDNWNLTRQNARTYWGFWATHIFNIYYSNEQLGIYKMLYEMIKEKEHFIITTNVDGQFHKGDFDSSKVWAMQGSYGHFQCQEGCHNEIYSNKESINDMLNGLDKETLLIREEDIPICEKCSALMHPNIRIDSHFVEAEHMENRKGYIDFINNINREKVVFLELGVGFNTPVIIRYPFENMTEAFDNATLIRVNRDAEFTSEAIQEKSIGTNMDIAEVISRLMGTD